MQTQASYSNIKQWPQVVRGPPRKAWEGFQNEIGKTVFRTTSKAIIQKGAIFNGGATDDYPFRNLSVNIAHLRNGAFVPCSHNTATVSPVDFYFHLIAPIMLQREQGIASKEMTDEIVGRLPYIPERVYKAIDLLHEETTQRQQQQQQHVVNDVQPVSWTRARQQPRSKLIELYPNLPLVTLTEIKSQERAFDFSKPVKFARGVGKKSFFHVMTVDDFIKFYNELPRLYSILTTLQSTKQREKVNMSHQSSLNYDTQSVDSMLEQHEIAIGNPVTMLNNFVAQHKMGLSVHELYGVSVYLKYDVTTPDGFKFPFAKLYMDSNEVNFLLERKRFILGELMFIRDANVAFTGKSSVEEAERDPTMRNNNDIKTVYHSEELIQRSDGEQESVVSLIEMEESWPALQPQPTPMVS